MGYDIYCRGPHLDVQEARQTALGIDRDSPESLKAWERYWELERTTGAYFRVNIFGMGPLVEAMEKCGALDSTPHPPWPDPWPTTTDDSVHPDVLAILAYEGETPFIPVSKLGSNDGWIITPKQAKASHEAMDAFAAEEVIESDMIPLWDQWVHFLGHVPEHDGAEVH